jgi:hypothetical protein
MHMLNPPYPLWSIWRSLSLLDHGLVLMLGGVFAYCVFSTINTMLTARAVWSRPNQDRKTVADAITILAARYSRLRQINTGAFYLFGFVLFLGLENIANIIADGKEPLGVYVLDNFLLSCAFAANVFLIFLLLHSIQWAGSAVLGSLSRRAINSK